MSHSGEFPNPQIEPEQRAAITRDNQMGRFDDPEAFSPLLINEFPERVYSEALQEVRIQAMLAVLRAHDPATADHSMRVGMYAAELAYQAQRQETDIKYLAEAGILHDLGKINIDPKVLNSDMTPEQYETVKHHPKSGYDEIRGLFPADSPVPELVLTHHCYKASPYTDSATAEQGQPPADPKTRQLGEMLASADIYDALFSNRNYNSGLTPINRRQLLQRIAQHEFAGDPLYLQQLMDMHDKQRPE